MIEQPGSNTQLMSGIVRRANLCVKKNIYNYLWWGSEPWEGFAEDRLLFKD